MPTKKKKTEEPIEPIEKTIVGPDTQIEGAAKMIEAFNALVDEDLTLTAKTQSLEGFTQGLKGRVDAIEAKLVIHLRDHHHYDESIWK